MTKPSDERETCPECLRPKARDRKEWNAAMFRFSGPNDHADVCGRYTRDYEGEATQECQELTIARLRQELAVRDERIGRLLDAIVAHVPSVELACRILDADDAARGKEPGT